MRVLLTGASGFVGSWLTKHLVAQGLEVTILNRSARPPKDLQNLKIQVIEGDVLNEDSILNASKNVDSIFHLAGVVAYTRSQRQIMDAVNIQGTQNILNACAKNKVRRLLHFSSVVAVGASFDGKSLLNEESKFNLSHLNLGYFESKKAAEELVRLAAQSGQVDAVMVNPSTIYGPGDAQKGSRSVQLKVARAKFPFIPPGGVNVISIEDVVAATVQAWKIGKTGERYILAGENLLLKDVFKIIAEIAGVPPPHIAMPKQILLALGRIGDFLEKINRKGPINSENAWASVLYHWFDNSKAKRELGLNPKPARYALEQSVNWMKEHSLI